ALAAALYAGPQTSPDRSSQETATLDSSSNRLGQWEQNGVEVDASLVLDVSRTSGGLESDDFGRYLADINFALDMESLAGIEGASIGVDLYAQAGRNASDAVGDVQGVSNIDTINTKIIAEVWWQQKFANDRLRIKVGKVEANSEFASPSTAGEFLNSSMGFSPTISAFPSYPNPAYSISAFVHGEHSYVGLGVFDGATQAGIATGNHGAGSFLGNPSDLFWVLEASTEWDRGLSARAACGLWYHSGTFDTFAGGTDEGTSGFYGILEHGLWVEDAAHAQTVDGF
ncbi:MAG: carbohydrate porin, partial [Planctomycetota bacterium]|nr:carbohydrate porin [Planctomycetota bacterium]